MNGPTQEEVREALRMVIDPELGLNIVDLGLVYEVALAQRRAAIRMTMTTPACPLGPYLTDQVTGALRLLPGIDEVAVEVVFFPPWRPERMSDSAKQALGWFD